MITFPKINRRTPRSPGSVAPAGFVFVYLFGNSWFSACVTDVAPVGPRPQVYVLLCKHTTNLHAQAYASRVALRWNRLLEFVQSNERRN